MSCTKATTDIPLSDVCCEYSLKTTPRSVFELMLKIDMMFSHPFKTRIQSSCVNTVLSDLWPSAETLPNNTNNTNLFEQLHTLSHVLLTEQESGSMKMAQNGQGTKKNLVADVDSYPVRVWMKAEMKNRLF